MHALAHAPAHPQPLRSVVASWSASEFAGERPRVAIPRAEVQLVVRFGPAAREGVDVHVLGAQQTVRRKLVRGVRRAVVLRCALGSTAQIFGVQAAELAGRMASIDALWGDRAAQSLRERLAGTRDASQAAAMLQEALAHRAGASSPGDARAELIAHAGERLVHGRVRQVAGEVGLSERHLRRLFHQATGMSPKRFERIARFHRAVRAAWENGGATWAGIAAEAGYYDQAHLIEEFHSIAGTTPAAFLRELGEARSTTRSPD